MFKKLIIGSIFCLLVTTGCEQELIVNEITGDTTVVRFAVEVEKAEIEIQDEVDTPLVEILVYLAMNKPEAERDTGIWRQGDIIIAKKFPAIWGSSETQNFLITTLYDTVLYNYMKSVEIYPYAAYKEILVGTRKYNKMLNRSRYRVDLQEFFGSLEPTGKRNPIEKEYLEVSDLILDETERTRMVK